MDDLRPAITYELGFQMKRGLINFSRTSYGLEVRARRGAPSTNSRRPASITWAIRTTVARQLQEFYEASGGFGTLLLVTGKDWATREKRARSMRLFMEQVAPKLRHLDAVRVPDSAVA